MWDQVLQDGKLRPPPEGPLAPKSGSTRQDRSPSSPKEPASGRVRRARGKKGHTVSTQSWGSWVMGSSEGIWAVGSPVFQRPRALVLPGNCSVSDSGLPGATRACRTQLAGNTCLIPTLSCSIWIEAALIQLKVSNGWGWFCFILLVFCVFFLFFGF